MTKNPPKTDPSSKPAARSKAPAKAKPAAKSAAKPKATAKPKSAAKPKAKPKAKPEAAPKPAELPHPIIALSLAAIYDLKAKDVTVLNVQSLTTITDTMIICTGTSNRHVKSIAEAVAEKCKEAGYRPLGMEGMEESEWVLVDLGHAIVHVMQVQARAFYQLEKLWDMREIESQATAGG